MHAPNQRKIANFSRKTYISQQRTRLPQSRTLHAAIISLIEQRVVQTGDKTHCIVHTLSAPAQYRQSRINFYTIRDIICAHAHKQILPALYNTQRNIPRRQCFNDSMIESKKLYHILLGQGWQWCVRYMLMFIFLHGARERAPR